MRGGISTALPFSIFSTMRRWRSSSSCSSAAFSLSVNIFRQRQRHRDLVALVIGPGAKHLNHLLQLVIGQFGHDVLDYELARHYGEHATHKLVRARSPHVKQRSLSFRQRAAFFYGLVPEFQHVSKDRTREAIADTTGPAVGVGAPRSSLGRTSSAMRSNSASISFSKASMRSSSETFFSLLRGFFFIYLLH